MPGRCGVSPHEGVGENETVVELVETTVLVEPRGRRLPPYLFFDFVEICCKISKSN